MRKPDFPFLFSHFSFLTLSGLAVFIVALVMLFRSLMIKNAYEILLSLAALFLWVVLVFTGAWTVRRIAASGLQPIWKPPFPLTAASGEEWQVTCAALRLPLFFRLHFFVRGRFFPQGTAESCAVFAETSLPFKGGASCLDLSFPLGGLFRGEASCRLRDIFGFFSFPCGTELKQTLNVRSAPCRIKALRIEPMTGAEDRRIKTSSNEERYYMREYASGDRLRDINWKSSERIDTLITKISPDNQEKVTRIEVCFRNYGMTNAGLSDLWLLDRAKARLAWFLRSVKDENASFVFNVSAATGSWELSGQDEIEAFLEELCSISFSPAQHEDLAAIQTEGGKEQKAGELYVFSTACDYSLPAFLLARQGRPITLFLAQNSHRRKAGAGKAKENKAADTSGASGASGDVCDYLRLRDFPASGIIPLSRRLFRRQERLMNVSGSRMIIDYAETRL